MLELKQQNPECMHSNFLFMNTDLIFYLSKLEFISQNAFVIEILIFTNVR